MLKEQAISLLTQVKELILGSESWLDSTHQPIEEAFGMAIEAIKTTQLNNSNTLNALDCISRQAAIDAFLTELTKRERKNLLHTWSTVEVKYFITDMLERLPSAQPERKTGRWIKLYPRAYKCSECKTWWEESEDDEIKEFTYCPKCGKKMEVENEHR